MKTIPPPERIGRYPTPVFRADALCTEDAELWIKNDGLLNDAYGGNKVRKLEFVLADALAKGARRIITMGAFGSHHVLATTLFARQRALAIAAVLCPQPWTEHAEETLRAGLGLGLEVRTAGSMARVPLHVPLLLRRGDYLVPAGASSALGTLGYLRAVHELVEQIRAGELPEPDVIVAPLGSGGTVAGLVAGVVREGLGSQVLGVQVAVGRLASESIVLALAWQALRLEHAAAGPVRLARRLLLDGTHLGRGYGWPIPAGERASELASQAGVQLDPTYTAKTFVKSLELVGHPEFAGPHRRAPGQTRRTPGQPFRVLYWHTLSSAPLEPLLSQGPASSELPASLRGLFLRS